MKNRITVYEHIYILASPLVAASLISVIREPLAINEWLAVFVVGLLVGYGINYVSRKKS
jgi:hypothetical protein